MQYKIGQRVKCRGKEGYLIHYCVDDDYWHIDINGQVESCYDTTELSPLYKPGDKVRVKSREEIKNHPHVISWPDLLNFAGNVEVLDFKDTGDCDFPAWAFNDEECHWIPEDIFEWYSGVEDKPEKFGIDELVVKNIDAFNSVEFNNCLIAEVHQDKDRNRAALAEVLKIQEPTTNKWMCPKCRFTGSIHDIRQHCVVAHGESLPPPESTSYWETWRVS